MSVAYLNRRLQSKEGVDITYQFPLGYCTGKHQGKERKK